MNDGNYIWIEISLGDPNFYNMAFTRNIGSNKRYVYPLNRTWKGDIDTEVVNLEHCYQASKDMRFFNFLVHKQIYKEVVLEHTSTTS